MRVFDGHTRTAEDSSVWNCLQAKGGANEQSARRPDQGCGRVVVHSSIHAIALAQGGAGWRAGGQAGADRCHIDGRVTAVAGGGAAVQAPADGA